MIRSYKNIKTLLFCSAILLTVLSQWGCKEVFPENPYTDILQFSVTDTSDARLKAYVSSSFITIYWPPLQPIPDSISPAITVSEKATVFPASGTKVPFRETTTYTVTAEDGTVKIYTLKPVINQPKPYMTSWTYVNNLNILVGDALGIGGDFFIPDTSQTHLYLVHKNGAEIPLDKFNTFTQTAILTVIPEVDSGAYHIKLTSGNYTIMSTGTVTVTYQNEIFISELLPSSSSQLTLKHSSPSTIGIVGAPASKITRLRIRHTDNTWHELPITGHTPYGVTINIPSDLPSGNYKAVEFTTSLAVAPYIWALENRSIIITD